MTDNLRHVYHTNSQEIGLWYVILANGDIITDGGQPIHIDKTELNFIANLPENQGKTITFRFRAPTEEEARQFSGHDAALARNFAEFQKLNDDDAHYGPQQPRAARRRAAKLSKKAKSPT